MVTRLTLAASLMSATYFAVMYWKERKKNKELQKQIDILIDEKKTYKWVKVKR